MKHELIAHIRFSTILPDLLLLYSLGHNASINLPVEPNIKELLVGSIPTIKMLRHPRMHTTIIQQPACKMVYSGIGTVCIRVSAPTSYHLFWLFMDALITTASAKYE